MKIKSIIFSDGKLLSLRGARPAFTYYPAFRPPFYSFRNDIFWPFLSQSGKIDPFGGEYVEPKNMRLF
jgi:hypothetical protein